MAKNTALLFFFWGQLCFLNGYSVKVWIGGTEWLNLTACAVSKFVLNFLNKYERTKQVKRLHRDGCVLVKGSTKSMGNRKTTLNWRRGCTNSSCWPVIGHNWRASEILLGVYKFKLVQYVYIYIYYAPLYAAL